MSGLSLDLFLEAIWDLEIAYYKIRARLEEIRKQFNQGHLYPVFSDLIELKGAVEQILSDSEVIRIGQPRAIRGINWKSQCVVREGLELTGTELDRVEDLMYKVLPVMQEVLNEGKERCGLIYDQIKIETMGIVPIYVDEGHFVLLCPSGLEWYVYRYQKERIVAYNEKVCTLRTRLVSTIPRAVNRLSVQQVRKTLGTTGSNMPVSMIYRVECAVPSPLEQALVPLTKRKLLREPTAQGFV